MDGSMTDKPIERFDRLLKAMVQGEPPKARKNVAADPEPENGSKKNLGRDDRR